MSIKPDIKKLIVNREYFAAGMALGIVNDVDQYYRVMDNLADYYVMETEKQRIFSKGFDRGQNLKEFFDSFAKIPKEYLPESFFKLFELENKKD